MRERRTGLLSRGSEMMRMEGNEKSTRDQEGLPAAFACKQVIITEKVPTRLPLGNQQIEVSLSNA